MKGLCYSYVKAAPNQLLNIQHNITTNDSSTVWFGNSGLDGTKLVKSAPKKACISSAVGVRIAKRKEKKNTFYFPQLYDFYRVSVWKVVHKSTDLPSALLHY